MASERETLLNIGFSKNEVDIYLCLLSNGELTAYHLAQKTGIHRPHVYDKIEILMSKGLVSEVKKGRRKFFKAAQPGKIKALLEEKIDKINSDKQALEKILPKLTERNKTQKEETNIDVYRGTEGLKGFLRDIAETGKNICIMGLEEEYYQEYLPLGIQKYFSELIRRKLKERAIIRDKPNALMFKTETTEYRKLVSHALNPSNIYVYGNKVGIIIWGNPITVIKIENKNVASTQREYFEYLWKLAKPA